MMIIMAVYRATVEDVLQIKNQISGYVQRNGLKERRSSQQWSSLLMTKMMFRTDCHFSYRMQFANTLRELWSCREVCVILFNCGLFYIHSTAPMPVCAFYSTRFYKTVNSYCEVYLENCRVGYRKYSINTRII